jgi:hypothetical protein
MEFRGKGAGRAGEKSPRDNKDWEDLAAHFQRIRLEVIDGRMETRRQRLQTPNGTSKQGLQKELKEAGKCESQLHISDPKPMSWNL